MNEADKGRSWEKQLTRIDDQGKRLLYGFPIFGGWLPYLGFDSIIEYDDVMNPSQKIVIKFFRAEFVSNGYAIVYSAKITEMFGKD